MWLGGSGGSFGRVGLLISLVVLNGNLQGDLAAVDLLGLRRGDGTLLLRVVFEIDETKAFGAVAATSLDHVSRLDLVVGEGGFERVVGGGKREVGNKHERLGRLALWGALGCAVGLGRACLCLGGFGLGFSSSGGGLAVGSSGGGGVSLLLLPALGGFGRLGAVCLSGFVAVGGGLSCVLLGGALLALVSTCTAWRTRRLLGLLGSPAPLLLVGISSRLGLGQLYADLATAHITLVKELNSGLCFRFGGEGDESVSDGTSAASDDLSVGAVRRGMCETVKG